MYFNGALSLQPEGLRPITSLSTLDRHGCPYRPKTRYQVRWVTLLGRHLQPLANTAPRGAQLVSTQARDPNAGYRAERTLEPHAIPWCHRVQGRAVAALPSAHIRSRCTVRCLVQLDDPAPARAPTSASRREAARPSPPRRGRYRVAPSQALPGYCGPT